MDISGVGAASGLHAVSGASNSGPPQQKMSNLFDAIDSSGSGSITQAQFEQAFQSKNPPTVFQQQGADAIFSKLDPNGTGSVSKSDFVSTMSQLMASLRAPAAAASTPSPSTTLSTSTQTLDAIGGVGANAQPGSLINLQA